MSHNFRTLLVVLALSGCAPASVPSDTTETISIRPNHFLTPLLTDEEGMCWQLLVGGLPYFGETVKGRSLNGVAAIEAECHEPQPTRSE